MSKSWVLKESAEHKKLESNRKQTIVYKSNTAVTWDSLECCLLEAQSKAHNMERRELTEQQHKLELFSLLCKKHRNMLLS